MREWKMLIVVMFVRNDIPKSFSISLNELMTYFKENFSIDDVIYTITFYFTLNCIQCLCERGN